MTAEMVGHKPTNAIPKESKSLFCNCLNPCLNFVGFNVIVKRQAIAVCIPINRRELALILTNSDPRFA